MAMIFLIATSDGDVSFSEQQCFGVIIFHVNDFLECDEFEMQQLFLTDYLFQSSDFSW